MTFLSAKVENNSLLSELFRLKVTEKRKKKRIRRCASIPLSINSFSSQGSEEWGACSRHNAQLTEEFQTSHFEISSFFFALCLNCSQRMGDECTLTWLLRAVCLLTSSLIHPVNQCAVAGVTILILGTCLRGKETSCSQPASNLRCQDESCGNVTSGAQSADVVG